MITISLGILVNLFWPWNWRGDPRPQGMPAVYWYREIRGRNRGR